MTSQLKKYFLDRVEDLKKVDEIRGKKIEDALYILKFTDGHIHHQLPYDGDLTEELIEDIISMEGLSFKTEVEEKKEIEPYPIILKNRQAIGDILMFTCAVRDMKKAYPEWPIMVNSTAMHIWDYNPNIDRSLTTENAKVIEIGPSYLTNASNRDDRHFANAYRISIEEKLGIKFKQGLIKPDIYMTEEEAKAPPLVEPPYWLILAGEKGDWTSKTYPVPRWQEIVSGLPQIKFVQMGTKEHVHSKLQGDNVVDFIGKTQDRHTGIRNLFKLFYHAEGSIGLVSFQMHLAAAFGMPCVTIAGGREPVSFTRYPGHQYLASDGCLPCALPGKACWSCKMEESCKDVVGDESLRYPLCVALITADEVKNAILRYYDGGRLKFDSPREPVLPNPVAKGGQAMVAGQPIAQIPAGENPARFGMEWGGSHLTDRDWLFMKKVITDNNVRTVLEFGPGLSTLLLSDHVEKIVAYENEQRFIDKIKHMIADNVEIRVFDGVDCSSIGDEKFDLVFVDGPSGGKTREFTIKAASEHSDIVIVHDGGRKWEKIWQKKYLDDKFGLVATGGHRCCLWKRGAENTAKDIFKNMDDGKDEKKIEIVEPRKLETKIETKIIEVKRLDASEIVTKPMVRKLLRMVFNGRGDGGAEHSTTFIMNRFIEMEWNVEYVCPNGQPSATFRRDGSKEVILTDNLTKIGEPCDILMLYTNDWVWEFKKDPIKEAFGHINASRTVMAVNFRIGDIGKIEWTKQWDQFIFLNSYMEGLLLERIPDSTTKVLAPPIPLLDTFLNVKPNISGNLRLIRHSSQGDTKYDKEFNKMIGAIIEEVPDVEIHLMPPPSFISDAWQIGNTIYEKNVIKYKRNQPPIWEFLTHGNCFWYLLPNGYHDMGPKVIMEAQAAGLPVIADNHSGAKDRVSHQTNGILCNNFGEHLMAIKEMNDESKRLTFGGRGRAHAKKEYNPENWIKAILGEQHERSA